MAIRDALFLEKDKILPHLDVAHTELSGTIMNSEYLIRQAEEMETKKLILMMELHVSRIKKVRKELLKTIKALQKIVPTQGGEYQRAKREGTTLFKHIIPLERVIERIKDTEKQRNKISKDTVITIFQQNILTLQRADKDAYGLMKKLMSSSKQKPLSKV